MDRATIDSYEQGAAAYRAERAAYRHERAEAFRDALPDGAVRLDLGCGPGLYLPYLGPSTIAADAAEAMLTEARSASPSTPLIRCDLGSLPFRRGSLAGAWASKAHQHLPADDLPGALAEVHRVVAVGGRFDLTMFAVPEPDDDLGGEGREGLHADGAGTDTATWTTGPADRFPGRLFTLWHPQSLTDLLVGAGFSVDHIEVLGSGPPRIEVTAHRLLTLADSVAGAMRLLVCGLNPSILSAEVGVGFARPGNRFWPAMRMAGLTDHDRDVPGLLTHDHIGMTDLVKRPSVGAAELTTAEYRAGLDRVAGLCRRLRPAAICFVGLAGWRAAADRKAQPGWQAEQLGPTPVYVMPSTSGLNAGSRLEDLADHLRAASRPPPD